MNAKNLSGATGLMQIIPKWHPGVNVNNPYDSIFYSASLMRKYYDEFDSWEKALAAYNWGETNLRTHGIDNAPVETQKYVSDISQDVGL